MGHRGRKRSEPAFSAAAASAGGHQLRRRRQWKNRRRRQRRLSSLGAIALNTATAFFIGFSAIILSFFFLLNDAQIAEWFAGMFPERKRETARKLADEVTQLFGSYIRGRPSCARSPAS